MTSPHRISRPSLPGAVLWASCVAASAAAPEANPTPSPVPVVSDCPTCPDLVLLPGGEVQIGSPGTETGRTGAEGPVHTVHIRPFLLGKFEVTQAQWKAWMGSNRSRFVTCGDACPVEQVSWKDAQLFLERLSAAQGKHYRLPTEAEWEYAARGGSAATWPSGEGFDNLAQYAWFSAVSSRSTHPVGSKLPNAYGLHDMSGNVWEWVEDVWHDSYTGAPEDGSAWVSGGDPDRRVVRGGSWNYGPNAQRPAHRYWGSITSRDYDLGFRVARDLTSTEGNLK